MYTRAQSHIIHVYIRCGFYTRMYHTIRRTFFFFLAFATKRPERNPCGNTSGDVYKRRADFQQIDTVSDRTRLRRAANTMTNGSFTYIAALCTTDGGGDEDFLSFCSVLLCAANFVALYNIKMRFFFLLLLSTLLYNIHVQRRRWMTIMPTRRRTRAPRALVLHDAKCYTTCSENLTLQRRYFAL